MPYCSQDSLFYQGEILNLKHYFVNTLCLSLGEYEVKELIELYENSSLFCPDYLEPIVQARVKTSNFECLITRY